MKNVLIYIITLICLFSFNSAIAQADCSFAADQQGFEYTVDLDLDFNSVTTSQIGSSCLATVVVDYTYMLTTISTPPFQSDPVLFNLQISMSCDGATNNPQNSGNGAPQTMGMFQLTNFSFADTDCSTLIVNCPFTVTISGSGGYSESGVDCDVISSACARSIF